MELVWFGRLTNLWLASGRQAIILPWRNSSAVTSPSRLGVEKPRSGEEGLGLRRDGFFTADHSAISTTTQSQSVISRSCPTQKLRDGQVEAGFASMNDGRCLVSLLRCATRIGRLRLGIR